MNNYVKVISAEVRPDRNGRDYNRATVASMSNATVTDTETGEVHTVLTPTVTVRTIGHKVPYLYDADDSSAVPDYIWNAKVGDLIQGMIVRREVVPYEIDGQTRNTAKVFVQGDPTDVRAFEIATELAFENAGRDLAPNSVRIPTESIIDSGILV